MGLRTRSARSSVLRWALSIVRLMTSALGFLTSALRVVAFVLGIATLVLGLITPVTGIASVAIETCAEATVVMPSLPFGGAARFTAGGAVTLRVVVVMKEATVS